MAKDRRTSARHTKPLTKKQRYLRIGCIAGAGVVGIIAIVAVCLSATSRAGESASPDLTAATTVSTTCAPTTAATCAPQTTQPPTETQTQPTYSSTTAPATQPSAAPSSDGQYVQAAGASWNLKLVNRWNRMTQEESDGLPIDYYGNGEYCDSRIADALDQMLAAGSQYGLYVTSGYRSYSLQSELFENKIYRVQQAYGCGYDEAADIAATEVARPGTSEHNTGLAVDLLYDGCWELERYWEDGAAFDWMIAHCAEYGFILRFPDGKEDVTGVIYEPWHYRYVGVEAATEIMNNGLTLEEYLQNHGL